MNDVRVREDQGSAPLLETEAARHEGSLAVDYQLEPPITVAEPGRPHGRPGVFHLNARLGKRRPRGIDHLSPEHGAIGGRDEAKQRQEDGCGPYRSQ